MGEHDPQLNQIYDAMKNLLDEKAAQRKWEEREKIGFKTETNFAPTDFINSASVRFLILIITIGRVVEL